LVVSGFGDDPKLRAMARTIKRRNRLALLLYTLAIPAAYVHPYFAFALIFGPTLFYFFPEKVETANK
jgi:hypothetical protein